MQEWVTTAADTLAVTSLPFMDRYQLLPYYAACDFVALPSFYDGFPNVLLESLGLAVPVIAAGVGGMADILRDHDNALLFSPGDQHACRDALEQAAHLAEADVRTLGVSGQQLVLSQFTHHAETARYLAVFREVELNKSKP